ncbi:hypothetical protein GOODEAATRI_000142 [Goodea atripinnis]|uniref:Uncharacterized protein n=1 Tax=Goodea atripinnis TaxID=208336 RepID=A0ABV0NQL5_9TELE
MPGWEVWGGGEANFSWQLPAVLWASLPPYCPGLACLLWHLLLGRGNAVQGPNAHTRSGWGYPIDKDTLQAKNRCSRLSKAEFRLCRDGCVVIYLEERKGWAEREHRQSGGVGWSVEHTVYKKVHCVARVSYGIEQNGCTVQ